MSSCLAEVMPLCCLWKQRWRFDHFFIGVLLGQDFLDTELGVRRLPMKRFVSKQDDEDTAAVSPAKGGRWPTKIWEIGVRAGLIEIGFFRKVYGAA